MSFKIPEQIEICETIAVLENLFVNVVQYCHVLRMGSVTNNMTRVRIGYRIYSLWGLNYNGYNYNEHFSTGSGTFRLCTWSSSVERVRPGLIWSMEA
jgi:hypothetical protein